MSRLVFLDLETTGLDPRKQEIIEIACIVTDDNFAPIDLFECLVKPCCLPERWEPAARDMHTKSGLAQLADEKGIPVYETEVLLKHFLRKHREAAGTVHLCGNSVHFDRSFLAQWMPDVEKLFHHRQIDVSSLRMVGERVTKAPQLPGEKPHRALDDVRRSLAELQHWITWLELRDGQASFVWGSK